MQIIQTNRIDGIEINVLRSQEEYKKIPEIIELAEDIILNVILDGHPPCCFKCGLKGPIQKSCNNNVHTSDSTKEDEAKNESAEDVEEMENVMGEPVEEKKRQNVNK